MHPTDKNVKTSIHLLAAIGLLALTVASHAADTKETAKPAPPSTGEAAKPRAEKQEGQGHVKVWADKDKKAAAPVGPRGKPPVETSKTSGQATVCPHGGAPASCPKCHPATEGSKAVKPAAEKAK